MHAPTDPTLLQLSQIAEIATGLKEAGVRYWLFGGWAVDFLVGEITRPHADVDLMIRLRDAPALRQLLLERGYDEHPSPSGPELDARFSKQAQLVEIMFLHEPEEGGACWGDWRLPSDALEGGNGQLGEVSCPVVSPWLLLDCKEACVREESDPAERQKHSKDIERLRAILAGQQE